MAFSCSSVVSLLLLALLAASTAESFAVQAAAESTTGIGSTSPQLIILDCGSACAARCRLSSRPNLCKRACGTCCYRCNCVPPGTSGNHEVCPCYANMKTHGGRPKCP